MPTGVPIATPIDGHDQAADDGVEKAAGRAGRRRVLVKTASDRPATPFQNSATQDQDEKAQAERRRREAEREGDAHCGDAAHA